MQKGQDTIRICDRMPNYFYGDEWVDLEPGIYLVCIKTHTGLTKKKIIKK